MEEIFKNISGYEGLYQISNLGNVKSISLYHYKTEERILKYSLGSKGYPQVLLQYTNNGIKHKNSISIHRLVAKAFIPNPENKPQVNHKNGIKTDNRVVNLEWVTNGENVKYSYDLLGRSKIRPKWTNDMYKKLTKQINQYTKEGIFIKTWQSGREIEKILGFNHSAISKNCKGKTNLSYGYKWKYAK